MNDDNLITVSCKLNPDTVATIEREAEKAAMSRSEYLRTLILSSLNPVSKPAETPETRDPTVLLHQILFGLDRLHHGMYIIAETAGVLPQEQLKSIADKTASDGIDFLGTVDERVARTRRQLAERRPAAPHTAEK